MAENKPHIVIAGGGFSGAATAIHLARAGYRDLMITLVEPNETPGAGVAYSTPHPVHRINVPAERMQLAGAPEGEFDRWYRQQPAFLRDPDARRPDGTVYPQRSQFGRYVAEQFADARQRSDGRLVHLRQRAIDWDNYRVITDDGRHLPADLLILAVSHPPPALPGSLRHLTQHGALIANPWATGQLENIAPHHRVAIMGTGLTMADVAAALEHQGHQGPVLAFSRHGLLSQPNLSAGNNHWLGDYTSGTLRQQVRRIREDVALAGQYQQTWQQVLDTVRQHAQVFWHQLSDADRRRFTRHLRRFWDVHRYRIAPQVAESLERLRQDGILQTHSARLETVDPRGDALAITLKHRQGPLRQYHIDHLILTTGPDHGNLIASQPLLSSLADQGLLRPDPLGLGIDVDRNARALTRNGESQSRLLVAGPAARGQFGELMGLPQVADHAALLAHQALDTLSAAGYLPNSHSCPAA